MGCGLGWAEGIMRYRRAHWHNLANTTELFVCGSDAALGQITLTTCWRFYPTSFTVCMDLSAHRVSGTPRKLSVLVCRDPTLYSKSRSKFSRKSSHLVCWSTSSGNDGSVTRMSGQSFRLPCVQQIGLPRLQVWITASSPFMVV